MIGRRFVDGWCLQVGPNESSCRATCLWPCWNSRRRGWTHSGRGKRSWSSITMAMDASTSSISLRLSDRTYPRREIQSSSLLNPDEIHAILHQPTHLPSSIDPSFDRSTEDGRNLLRFMYVHYLPRESTVISLQMLKKSIWLLMQDFISSASTYLPN